MKTRKQKISENSEKALASSVKGKRTLRSGGMWFQKGDVQTQDYLFEDKVTKDKIFSLDLPILQKVEAQSKRYLKMPVLSIRFLCHKNVSYHVAVVEGSSISDIDCYTCILEVPYNKSFQLKYEHARELCMGEAKSYIKLTKNAYFYAIIAFDTFIAEFIDSNNSGGV